MAFELFNHFGGHSLEIDDTCVDVSEYDRTCKHYVNFILEGVNKATFKLCDMTIAELVFKYGFNKMLKQGFKVSKGDTSHFEEIPTEDDGIDDGFGLF